MSTEQHQRPRSPWHAGERALQHSVGVAERMGDLGSRIIRDQIIEQHRAFYPQLPFVVLGTVDPEGDVWATLRDDEPGFMQAIDPYRLHLQLPRDASDPADRGMEDGQTFPSSRVTGIARAIFNSGNSASAVTHVRQRLNGWSRWIQTRAI